MRATHSQQIALFVLFIAICIQPVSAGVTTGIDIAPQVNSAFAMIALGFVVVAGVVILKILSSWH